ncbi:MAG TPA: rod shape-determining protein RodA [Candidatus Sphingobacterium stercoripullorum]|uniref:Cell wall polymerase n=1 Tax=Candidatus Sphingobacterium stercoripullorum TaxID=2838759 RepID=A0A9D2AYE2_9SPHI|nr:rod shape-determining protein RodA [Candidatus Sphingobacterium stercoripullorum]
MNSMRKRRLFGHVDWLTIILWFSLCIIGWFNIRAAVYDPNSSGLFDLNTNYGKQGLYILSATILAFIILLIDARFFITISPIVYIVTLLLLVLVLIVGRNVGGNQAWIPLGTFRLQPSEFAKFGTSLVLALFLSNQSGKAPSLKNLLIGSSIVFLPIVLIMLQPDTGSALAFFSLILVFYREGYFGTWVLVFGGLAIALFVLALLFNQWLLIGGIAILSGLIFYFTNRRQKALFQCIALFLASSAFILCVDFTYENILQTHQRNRIDVILGKIDDPRGDGYNLNQSKIAIGSGQLLGKGYLQGTQTKYNFVPEQSTDFIFCTIGEEWGFVGSVILVGLFVTLLLRTIHIAERQKSDFARIYGYATTSILFFHFFINIGMTIGLVPVIGIPLPFISYGGSSLWSFTILLFILLRLDASRKGLSG